MDTDQAKIVPPNGKTKISSARRANAWVPQKIRENHSSSGQPIESVQTEENRPPLAKSHACKASQRGYQLARDHLRRADRDLGETAAFIAGSLTTVTAIQAVISIAKDQLELSQEILQFAFQVYVAVFILILISGVLRTRSALRNRAQAERDVDQARKGIFEFCDPEQWTKPED